MLWQPMSTPKAVTPGQDLNLVDSRRKFPIEAQLARQFSIPDKDLVYCTRVVPSAGLDKVEVRAPIAVAISVPEDLLSVMEHLLTAMIVVVVVAVPEFECFALHSRLGSLWPSLGYRLTPVPEPLGSAATSAAFLWTMGGR